MTITIITPTHNRLNFLKEAVESVRQQVLEPLKPTIEHIVVDVASTDGTARWLARQHNLTVVTLKKKVNAAAARNAGLAQARGRYILPLDDDDILLQRTVYNFLQALSGRSWAVADFLRVDAAGRYLLSHDYWHWDFTNVVTMRKAMCAGTHFLQGNVAFARSLFRTVGGYDDSLDTAEDLDLYLRFLNKKGLPSFNSFISHLHRVHSSNTSRGITPARHLQQAAALRRKYQDVERAAKLKAKK